MNSSDFTESAQIYLSAKEKMDDAFLALARNCDSMSVADYNQSMICGTNYYTRFEQHLASISGSLEPLTKAQLEDVLISIENVLTFSVKFWETHFAVADKLNIQRPLPSNNTLMMSQAILKTYKPKKAIEIEAFFDSYGIPVKGFNMGKKIRIDENKIEWPSLIVGLILLAISLIIAFVIGVENGIQYWLIRIIGSLSGGFIIAGVRGSYIQAHFKIGKFSIHAIGFAATFLVLYLINPASAPKYDEESISIVKEK